MKQIILLLLYVFISASYSSNEYLDQAENCTESVCFGHCRCSSTISPLKDSEAPQLVSLTFEGPITDLFFTNYLKPLLFNTYNTDNNSISATFYVSHEYTDYGRVHELYMQGFEIGVNSVTGNDGTTNWGEASQENLEQEFSDQRTIISNFANIPEEDIVGVRTPQLQLQGDTSINAYVAAGLQYDSSWTSDTMLFPYTLDYLSTQKCPENITCPTQNHPEFWIAPIISINCSSLIDCGIEGVYPDRIGYLLLDLILGEYVTQRAPVVLRISSEWFLTTENSFEGFAKFLEFALTLDGIFFVSQSQILDWMKKPVSVTEFNSGVSRTPRECFNVQCFLKHLNDQMRSLSCCTFCPEVYPWLGNPLGLDQN